MAQPPPDRHPSGAGFLELNEALAAARDALLLFADAERVLDSLVCEATDPDCRYPDLAAVRQDASVDELLHLIAGLPDIDEDNRGDEANALYPTLLELAEVFDVFIEQTSLVHGDPVALAESMETEWHAMSGCCNHDPSPTDATVALKRMGANLEALPALIESVNRMSPQAKRRVAERFDAGDRLPWRAEARHLAAHGVEAWLPEGALNLQVTRAIQTARARSTGDRSATALFNRASADLVLGRLVRGIGRDVVADALEQPFADDLPSR